LADPTLDDPDYASFAWARYRRLMGWMAVASTIATVAGLLWLRLVWGPMPVVAQIFVAGGIFASVLLAAALMGLVFLSSGTGHDGRIEDPTRDEQWEDT
jgi:hypothetical protein